MREEFPEDVKRAVAARAGYRCSNPSCRASTAGPQADPDRSLNLGVAAHITAASRGGPRFNPSISSEERRSTENAIWLCQNCAKLIDNDLARYTETALRMWKADADARAESEVGKPTGLDLRSINGQITRLPVGARIRIRPAIPSKAEQDFYTLRRVAPDFIEVYKESNQQTAEIPIAATGIVYKSGQQFVLTLQGRMQWITLSQQWEFFPEEPPKDPGGEWGLWRFADLQRDSEANELSAHFPCRWSREDKVPKFLAMGWNIAYGNNGRYLRTGPGASDLILMIRGV